MLPYYLSIGMSWELYWEGECWLTRYYREAHKRKEQEINRNAWLVGLYVMQAIQTGTPVVLTGITKGSVELPKYPNKPIELESEKPEKEKQKVQEERQMQRQVAAMHALMLGINSKFQKRQEAAENAEEGK